MLLPSALGFSPHPPVSVYGTGTIRTIAAFLDAWLTYFPTRFRSASRLRIALRFFLQDSPRLHAAFHSAPMLLTCPQFCLLLQYRNLNLVVHRLRLASPFSPDLPRADRLYPETLRYSAERFSLPFFSSSFRHSLFDTLHSSFRYCCVAYPMLLYQCLQTFAPASVSFQPRTFFGAGPLDQ